MTQDSSSGIVSPGKMRVFHVLLLVGVFTLIGGLIVAPERVWTNLLLWGNYLIGLCLAGLVFVAIQHVTTAGWSVSFRRIPERMSTLLPHMALLVLFVLFAGSSIFHWQHADWSHHPKSFWFKEAWLSISFFQIRAVLYVLMWTIFGTQLLKHSQRQDHDAKLSHTLTNRRISAGFLVVFALTFSLASFDWLMSLEYEWFSTIFAVYNFSGMMMAGLATMVLLMVWLKRTQLMSDFISPEHMHGVGKLLFGFSSFWMYMWFCQYMLIWYTNMPEETSHYITRTQGSWWPLFLLNIGLNWLIPFLVLLPAAAKRNDGLMVKISVVILLGRWLDLYMMIYPAGHPSPVFGVWEVGIAAGAVGLFFVLYVRAFRRGYPVPYNDPLLRESLNHHQ